MNIREFVNTPQAGTYDVQFDNHGNPEFITMDLRDGYMLSQPDTGIVRFTLTIDEVWEWLRENELGVETFYVGLWWDAGLWFLDISTHYTGPLDMALKLGAEYNQLAVWDNKAKEAINVR